MSQQQNKNKYYLGLDIGIVSVGWGIIGEETNGEHWLEDFGVRLFNVPEDPQNKKSLAEKRREFRGKRRLLNRWHCRREDLKKFFRRIFGNNLPQEFEIFTEKKKSTNRLEGKFDETKFFNPYVIRYQALSQKIEPVELLSILLHISKYRGYKEFYLDSSPEEKDEEVKKVYEAVGEVKKIIQENGYISVAEMVIKNEKFRHSQYKNLLSAHNHNPSKVYENKEEIKKVIIEVKKVLNENEYYERIKDQKGNIHYPYISYVSDHKVKEDFIASQQAGYRKRGEEILPDLYEKLRSKEKLDLVKNISLSKLVEQIGLEKLNSEYGKYNFLIVKNKKNCYTIWDTSKYAGFGLGVDGKSKKVKNIELLDKKQNNDRNWLTENYKWLLRPYETFTIDYSEDLESELMDLIGLPLIYTGTTKDNVSSINIVGLIYDKKENQQTIYPEHGDKIIKVKNTVNSLGTGKKSIKKISPSIKLLKIDILGKREK